MSFSTKLAAGVMLAAATSTALTGCGKKSSTTTSSKSPSMTASSSKTASSSMSTSSSTNGYVTATIGGQTKHIKAGQQCQAKHASDYTQYGFTCAANSSGVYVLTKN